MRQNEQYDQPSKRKVRREALQAAVEALTVDRSESCCIRQTYVREARDQLRRQGRLDRETVDQIDGDHIRAWEAFHQSETSIRRPADLKVAYLGGPDPTADFEVLIQNGVQPHNIWVFEGDGGTFETARAKVRSSQFKLLKLFHGSMEQFFEDVPRQFDIVYFDACGPLPSASQRTLRTVATMMRHQRLASPGVLLTNFAEPGRASAADFDAYTDVIAAYLYPKSFLEGVAPPANGLAVEGADVHGLCFDEFRARVATHLSFFYGQFVTRLLVDLGAVVVPARRAGNSALWRRLVTEPPPQFLKTCLAAHPDLYRHDFESIPISAALDTLVGGPAALSDVKSSRVATKLVQELDGLPAGGYSALDCVRAIEAFRRKPKPGWTAEFERVVHAALSNPLVQLCDVPTMSLVFDPVMGQIGYPYHCAPRNVRRWSYTAKATEMFVDLLVVDACRYIYDWIPSMQLLDLSFAEPSQQLVLRLAIDGVAKQRRWYNTDIFYGSAVISDGTAGFEAESLSARTVVS